MKIDLKIAALAHVSALALGMAMATAAPSAFAQSNAPAKAEVDVTEVVVTGSRIRGVAPVGSPLIAVGRDDIITSTAVTTAQLLQELPQVFNLGVSETSRGQSGGASNITYGSSVNVRGIGPYATLTIMNGHRAVPQGTSGFAIDPSILPTIGLERIDVVADGASAIYGSDAVAGVVNLILRRNINGIEANARWGFGNEYDEHQFGVALGKKWATGQFSLAFENGFHSALNGGDRAFYRGDLRDVGGGDFRVTNCSPGNIVVGGVSYAIPAGGVTAANRGALVANTQNKCDNIKFNDLIPRQKHNSLSFTFNQEIGERVSVFADGFAARRDFASHGGISNASLTVPSTNAFFVAPPGLTPTSETVQVAGLYPRGSGGGFSRAVNVTVGADVKVAHDWKVGVDYTWGRDQDQSGPGAPGTNAAAQTAALASSNPATALNPFGGATNAAVIDGILIGYSVAKGHTTFQGYEAKADGPVFALPGGEVRAAFGYEGQRYTVNTNNLAGTLSAKTGNARYFARGVNSFYGELAVPIVGPEMNIPGVRRIDVDLADRYDNYSDVGHTNNPKVGINWTPIDGMVVHGSWGTSFRAPGIAQIYGNTNTLFIQNYSDPTCNCIRQGITRSGGNLNLKPETATTYSFGVDWSPSFLPNAKVSITYFDIEYENQVTSYLSDLSVLQRESQFAGTGIIVRNPSQALIAQQLAETGFTNALPSPATLFVEGRSSNLGVTVAKGFDFQTSYRIPTDDWGDFIVSFNGTDFTEYKTAITPAAPLLDVLNTIYNPLKFKARAGLRWSKGPWSASGSLNYQNAYTNNLTTPSASVEAFETVDLHLNFAVGQQFSQAWLRNVNIGLDARNLTDEQPPFVNIAQSANGGGGFDPTSSDPIGRVISVSIGAKF